jgi:hypothetical protein
MPISSAILLRWHEQFTWQTELIDDQERLNFCRRTAVSRGDKRADERLILSENGDPVLDISNRVGFYACGGVSSLATALCVPAPRA